MKKSLMLISVIIILAWQTLGTASESGKPVVDPVALGNMELTFAGNEIQRYSSRDLLPLCAFAFASER